MTLKQAFTMWAYDPKNTALAARSRDAVQRVLMKKWNDVDLEQFTEAFSRRIFYQSAEPLEMKAKAASILVHVLQWGSDHGHCQRPAFTHVIASEEHHRAEKDKDNATSDGKPKEKRAVVPTLADVRASVLGNASVSDKPIVNAKAETKNEPKGETNMEPKEKRKRGKQPKPVAQLDAKTLQVIKVWPSRSEAEHELGAKNLDRAISRKHMSAGFFWCQPEDADGFKPNPLSKFAPKQKQQPKPKDVAEVPVSVARTMETHVTMTPVDALKDYTDEDLWKELERRGWQGELSKVQRVTIGINREG